MNDELTVAAACEYVRTETGAHIPAGPIVKGVGVDAAIPFHFIADSVRLVEVAIELCDGALMRTTAAVETYMRGATGQQDPIKAPYCPWGARPISVE